MRWWGAHPIDPMSFFPQDFLNFAETEHPELFDPDEPVWSALGRIGAYLESRLDAAGHRFHHGEIHARAIIGERVYVARGARIEANAVIAGPAWIGSGTVVRSGAYVRENVIAGNDCVLGNSSEFKNCVLFNRCEVPHFNYVGDSILGFRAHLGAGVICSNVRLDRGPVAVVDGGGVRHDTGLCKFGAVVGDHTEVGCNSVLGPGTILGRRCLLYPLSSWQGHLADRHIVKTRPHVEVVPRVD